MANLQASECILICFNHSVHAVFISGIAFRNIPLCLELLHSCPTKQETQPLGNAGCEGSLAKRCSKKLLEFVEALEMVCRTHASHWEPSGPQKTKRDPNHINGIISCVGVCPGLSLSYLILNHTLYTPYFGATGSKSHCEIKSSKTLDFCHGNC